MTSSFHPAAPPAACHPALSRRRVLVKDYQTTLWLLQITVLLFAIRQQQQQQQTTKHLRLTPPDGYFLSIDYDALNRPLSLKENATTSLATLATYTWDDLSRRRTLIKLKGPGSI